VNIHIPASLDEAKSALNGLGALLTAKQWERAAIVYAFTEPGNGQGRHEPLRKSEQRLSIAALAAERIVGLESRNTVAAYRNAWQSAIDDGQAQAVGPGDQVEVPSVPWKEAFGEATTDVQERIFRSVVQNPEQFRSALRDKPELAAQLARQVVDTPAIRFAVEERLSQPVPRREEADYGEPASRDAVRSSIDEAMEEWRKENAWRATMEALKYVTPLQRFSPEDVARDTPADDWEHTKNSLERAAALLSSFAARLAERSLRRVE